MFSFNLFRPVYYDYYYDDYYEEDYYEDDYYEEDEERGCVSNI
jgi:hypothetical protein